MLSISLVAIPAAQAQTFTLLYSFQGTPDGEFPGGELVFDKLGNLYGTTTQGGMSGIGGVLFTLDPAGTETILHSFGVSAGDGDDPMGRIARVAGNIYGTTQGGGKLGGMTCAFRGYQSGGDGAFPNALAVGSNGSLYGTAMAGGHFIKTSNCTLGCGVVFKLKQNSNGTWGERVIHKFGLTATDGQNPGGALLIDNHGNLYGVTGGGASGYGTVYKMDGAGNETILHTFAGGTNGREVSRRGSHYGCVRQPLWHDFIGWWCRYRRWVWHSVQDHSVIVVSQAEKIPAGAGSQLTM